MHIAGHADLVPIGGDAHTSDIQSDSGPLGKDSRLLVIDNLVDDQRVGTDDKHVAIEDAHVPRFVAVVDPMTSH